MQSRHIKLKKRNNAGNASRASKQARAGRLTSDSEDGVVEVLSASSVEHTAAVALPGATASIHSHRRRLGVDARDQRGLFGKERRRKQKEKGTDTNTNIESEYINPET